MLTAIVWPDVTEILKFFHLPGKISPAFVCSFTLGDTTSNLKTYSEIKKHWSKGMGTVSIQLTTSPLCAHSPSPSQRGTHRAHPGSVSLPSPLLRFLTVLAGCLKTRPAETSMIPDWSRCVCVQRLNLRSTRGGSLSPLDVYFSPSLFFLSPPAFCLFYNSAL